MRSTVNLLIHSFETRTFTSSRHSTPVLGSLRALQLWRLCFIDFPLSRGLHEIELEFSAKRRASIEIELFRAVYLCRRRQRQTRYFVYLIWINFSRKARRYFVESHFKAVNLASHVVQRLNLISFQLWAFRQCNCDTQKRVSRNKSIGFCFPFLLTNAHEFYRRKFPFSIHRSASVDTRTFLRKANGSLCRDFDINIHRPTASRAGVDEPRNEIFLLFTRSLSRYIQCAYYYYIQQAVREKKSSSPPIAEKTHWIATEYDARGVRLILHGVYVEETMGLGQHNWIVLHTRSDSIILLDGNFYFAQQQNQPVSSLQKYGSDISAIYAAIYFTTPKLRA